MSEAGTPLNDQPGFINIPQPGAVDIECAIYPPNQECGEKQRAMVIHLYGHNGSSREFNMIRPPYAEVRRQLREHGYWLAIPNLGGSHWMNAAAVQALDLVIDFMVKEHGINGGRVSMLGTSMGGGSSLIYARQRPGVIRALCAVFPMTNFSQWCEESPEYRQNILLAHRIEVSQKASFLHQISPSSHIDSYRGLPLLLIHGDADAIVPVHHSQDFAAALNARNIPVTYKEVRGIGHDDVVVEQLQPEIAAFLINKTDFC